MAEKGFSPNALEMQVAFEASCHTLKEAEKLKENAALPNTEKICKAAKKAEGGFRKKYWINFGKASLYTFIVAVISDLIPRIPALLADECLRRLIRYGIYIVISIVVSLLIGVFVRCVIKIDFDFSLEDVVLDERAKAMRRQYKKIIRRNKN